MEKEILEKNYYVDASVDVTGKVFTVPDDVVSIEEVAFMGNRAVRFAILPDTLTEVGDRAFAGCDDLWAVTIYSCDTAFGSDVFDTDNKHLSLLVFQGSTAEAYAMAHGLKYYYLDPEALDDPDIPTPPDPR